MRKGLRMLLLGAVFTVLLCTSALAAGEKGICNISGSNLTPQDASGNVVSSSQEVDGKQVYLNSERVQLGYSSATADNEYLVFVLEDGTTPTAENIVYIDQKSGTDANSGFNLYPSRLVSGKTYNVYVTSTGTGIGEAAGSFSYHADYVLGDVNGDNRINIRDVSPILLHISEKQMLEGTNFLAADVTGDSKVNIRDVSRFLLFIAEKISSFN